MVFITHFIIDNLRLLVAVLQLFLAAPVLRPVLALLAHNLLARFAEYLSVGSIAHLPGHRLALLLVREFLYLLRLVFLLNDAFLDRFSAALLLTHGIGLNIAQLLTNLVYSWTAFSSYTALGMTLQSFFGSMWHC